MKKVQYRKNRKGFTLAELLITVAITVILASFGFVSVSGYQRRLKLTEMDNTAREIFIAAQNHLTSSEASGSWKTVSGKTYSSDDLVSVNASELAGGNSNHTYWAILSEKGTEPSNSDLSELWNEILPYGSITESVRTEGQYIVVFDSTAASIYGVLYTDNSSNAFGSADSGFAFDLTKLSDYLDLVKKAQNARISYKSGNGNVYIGWYGGAVSQDDGGNGSVASAPTVYFDNAEILKLNFSYSGSDYSYAVLKFTGKTSGAEVTVDVKNPESTENISVHSGSSGSDIAKNLSNYGFLANTYHIGTESASFSISLDDVTDQKRTFENLFVPDNSDSPTKFVPGEDITVTAYAVLSDGTRTLSSSATANSLFESADKKLISISNARHLQNLDNSVSGIADAASSARLTRDITWKDEKGSFIEKVSELRGDNSSSTADITFCSIYNNFLTEFEGNQHKLIGFSFSAGHGENAGLFAESPNTGNGFKVSNVVIQNASAASGSDDSKKGNAGILLGNSTNNLEVSNIQLTGTINAQSDSSSAGGLIGAVTGGSSVKIRDIDITGTSSVTVSSGGSGSAGGLIGDISSGISTTIGSIDGSIDFSGALTLTVSSGENGSAGGLIGKTDAATSLSVSEVSIGKKINDTSNNSQSVLSVSGGNNAGGLIGTVAAGTGKSTTISGIDLSLSDYASISSNGVSGGLIGSLTSEVTAEVTISDCNFISRTAKGTSSVPDQVTGKYAAGGFIGTISEGNSGKVTAAISDSFSDTYVALNGSSAGASAGGFIGSISCSDGSVTIQRAYAAGRTNGQGKYDSDSYASNEQGRFNVYSPSNETYAGGFIGSSTAGSLTIQSSFSAASVYSDGDNSFSGGFIAALNGIDFTTVIKNSYSAGKVMGTGKLGAFIGADNQRSLAGSGCYALRGDDYNESIDLISEKSSGSDFSSVIAFAESDTDGSPFVVSSKATANPNDGSLENSRYPFKTSSQLSGDSYSLNNRDNQYFGDWEVPAEATANTALVAENGNKLTVHFAVPKGTDKFTIGVRGKTSNTISYEPVQIRNGTIWWDNFLDYQRKNDWEWKEHNNATKVHSTNESFSYSMLRFDNYKDFNAAYQTSSNSTSGSLITDSSAYDYYAIDLDDVTIKEHKFFSMFSETKFIPGEAIEFAVVPGWNNSFDLDTAGTVSFNSLFANDTTGNTAYIENIRHLENLDSDFSMLGISYTKAVQKDNIHWMASQEESYLKDSKTVDFVSDLKAKNGLSSVTLFGPYYDVSWENTFYPIENTSIKEYDGGGFTIENIKIDLTKVHRFKRDNKIQDNGATVFLKLADGVNIHDLTLNNVTATTGTAFGSAAGLVGSITNGTIQNVTLTGNSSISVLCSSYAGGIAAVANGSFNMSNCSAYGKNITISVSNWNSSAGGLVGIVNANNQPVKISDSQAAVLIRVQNISDSGGNRGGGLIGSINNAGTGSSIERSQSGGHTENGQYSNSNFNINLPSSQSNAGGLIGTISGSQLDIRKCYSTMSVYANQYAGGFIGQVSDGTVNVNNCYSTGLVGAGSAKGSFAGSIVNNSLSGSDNYYLNGINDSTTKPIGNGDSFRVEGKDEGTIPFSHTETTSAIKYDSTLSASYPYQAYTTYGGVLRHVGDWPESRGISVDNGNVLSVKIRLSDFHYSYFTDDLRIAIFGESSKKETFLFLRKISDNSFYVTKYGDDFSWDYDADSGTVTLVLDDISAERGSRRFAKQFPDFIPGEDLEIVADYNSTATFINDYRSNPSYYRVKTNSLFGDGSFNSRYDASTYSSSAASIAEKYGLNGNYSDTALILNTRHLENLSYDVSLYSESNLGKVNLAHAKQICDIDVSEFFSQVKEKHVYLDNTISDDSTLTVVKWTDDSRLIGIINDDLQSYDGGGHQISNLRIGNTLYYTMQDRSYSQLDSEIGMFACLLQHASSRDFSISNLTLVNPDLSGSSSTDAGALIGKVYSGNNVTISKVSVISEDDASSEINGAHAGGLIGVSEKSSITIKDSYAAGKNLNIAGRTAAGGLIGSASGSDPLTFSISNSSATAYVQQSADSVSDSVYSAGGLIGSLSWNGNASITSSYAGGHTSKGNYLDKVDSAEVGRVNVYSANGTAGGLIGYQSGNLSVDKCFSAASVGSGSGYAAGLIGVLSSDAPVSIHDSYSAGKIVKLSDQSVTSEILHTSASTGDWNQYLSFSNVRYLSFGSDFSSNDSAASDTGSEIPSSINVDGLKELVSEENGNKAENTVSYDASLSGEGQTGSYPYPVYTTVEVTGSDGTVLNQRTYFGDWTEKENASAKVNFFIEEVPEDDSEFFSSEELSPSPEASAGASAESTETPEASASADADAGASASASAETEPIESPAPASSAGAMNTEEEASPSPSAGGGTAVPYVHALKLSYPLLKEEETEEPSGTSEPSAASEPSEGVETEAGDLVTEEDNMMTIARMVEVGKTISLSPIHPVQDGYTLVGWRLVDSAEDEANTGRVSLEVMDGSGNQGVVHYDYDPDAVVTVEGDMNLKAVFVRNDLLSFGNTWTSSASAAYNPYPGNTNNCTWTAWQLVYETMGIRLPAWGDAGYWLIRAKAAGFTVSSEPAENSLIVFSNHVGFVTDVSEDGQMVYIKEGNYSGMYHEGWWPAYGDRHGQKRYGYIWLSGSGTSDITEEELAEMEKEQAAREEAETEQKETEETIVISDGYYVGNNETALLQDLAEKGLSVGTRSEAYSNTAEAGTIIAHDSGTFAKGAAVNYTVSLGKEQVTEETAEPSLTPEASASASASAPAPSVSEITETVVPSASASASAPSVSEITVTAAPSETSEPANTPVPSVTEIEASPSAAASSAPAESAPVPSVKEIVPAASETPSASASSEE